MTEFLHNHIVLILVIAGGVLLAVPTGVGVYFLGKRLRAGDLASEQRQQRCAKRGVRASRSLRGARRGKRAARGRGRRARIY